MTAAPATSSAAAAASTMVSGEPVFGSFGVPAPLALLAATYSDRSALLAEVGTAASGRPVEFFTAERLSEMYRQPVKAELDAETVAPHVIPLR